MTQIQLNDLRARYLAHQPAIDAAVQRVLASGWYILGQEVAAFEAEFAAACGAAGCVGVNSGTDALHLALLACNVGPGDEVITVAHTAVATVAAIRLAGATPVLVDIDPVTYTMSPAALAAAITPRTKAVIPVHLYGHPADLPAIADAVRTYGLWLIEDCAQAHGALSHGRPVGSVGDLACFSFYPTKNLGALGDGGAVTSRDPDLLARVRSLREYGWTPTARYISFVEGMNSRLDELQAAILRVFLPHLDAENAQRRALAAAYAGHLPAGIVLPVEQPGCRHVYHLYVVRVPERDRVRDLLAQCGVGAGIHYPVPVHLQPGYRDAVVVPAPLTATERAAEEILSLPMHPGMTVDDVAQVAAALADALQQL
jgi:dTDP-3-amino-3,4,6-trideoxy-alpha-D-glucose transaminase